MNPNFGIRSISEGNVIASAAKQSHQLQQGIASAKNASQ